MLLSLGSLSQYPQSIVMICSGATTALKKSIKELDEVTDEMTEAAITGVTKSVSSLWNVASGYANQMFTEDDLPAGIEIMFYFIP